MHTPFLNRFSLLLRVPKPVGFVRSERPDTEPTALAAGGMKGNKKLPAANAVGSENGRSLRALALFACLFVASSVAPCQADDKLKALIIDGQNNHVMWPKTTVMMKEFLEDSGRFTVDVQRTQYTWKGGKLLEEFPLGDGKTYEDLSEPKSDPEFKPVFADYDVVVSNFGWKAAPWPQSTQDALVDFVSKGGGLVIVHAADNSFGDWPEFNKMIGLGGWDGRTEKSGPYVYIDDQGETVRDDFPKAFEASQRSFAVAK